jgi:asparagine synthase (glutamine-hydrolysing)
MCGIVGIRDLTSTVESNVARIRRMCDTLVHRGPDGTGHFCDDGVAMGMRRLAVIDLEGGNQPMFNEDGTVVTVFNGEIYNFRALRAELAAAGHRFATQSDTEVIVHGYEQWGVDVFGRLNGMFAIALLDRRNRRLMLARDHAGIKPLYYAWDGQRLVWGSEIKAVLASGLVQPKLDLDALGEFLAWEYVPCPGTLFEGIRKLPPATCWRLDLAAGTVSEDRYWRLPEPDGETAASDAEWIDRLDATLASAVRRQMVSDVPLGAFLSGGVDSSLLVAAMGRPQTFSIGFEDPSYNELAQSQRIASHLGTDHVTEVIGGDSLELFSELLDALDDPIADSSIFPTYLLARLARRHVTVSLSGDGGDELFGGYETYTAWALEDRYRALPAPFRKGLVEPLVRRLRPRAAKKGLINKSIRFVEGLGKPRSVGHAKWRMYLSTQEAAALFTPEAARSMTRPLDRHLERLYTEAGARQPLDQALRADFGSFLPDDILVKLDRASMAVSLEARVPYLDKEVVELAFRMPARLKIRDGQTKWILKKVAERYLPRENVYRPKEGFSAPLKQWIAGSYRPLMEELLDERQIAQQGLFSVDRIRRLKREHLGGQRNNAHLLWSLMLFQGWQRRWLATAAHPARAPAIVAEGRA